MPVILATEEMKALVRRMLRYIGEDITREGLLKTPLRVVDSWKELFRGYNENPKDYCTTFKEGTCQELVVLKEIEFYSTCEHHLLPFHGRASVGYVPSKCIIGVSKIARIVDTYSRRLQTQERLTSQIADCMVELLNPRGVMVVMEATHLCMVSRGVSKQHSKLVTSAIRGVMEKPEVRSEFLRLIQ